MPTMDRIRAVCIAGVMLYAGLTTLWNRPVVGQEPSSLRERVAEHGQQLADATRRLQGLDELRIGERLARIETQLATAATASERAASLGTGALLCLLTLLGERLFSMIAERKRR